MRKRNDGISRLPYVSFPWPRPIDAATKMAEIDRCSARDSVELGRIKDWASEAQQLYFSWQQSHVSKMWRLEAFVGLLVVGMVGAAVLCGALFARRLRDSIDSIEIAKGQAEEANRSKSEFLANIESRDPHSDERCDWANGTRPADSVDRRSAAAPGIGADIRRFPDDGIERYLGLFQDGGRKNAN